ncbi:MAG: hypothetical protein WCA84_13485 [Ignavibacteriaceae bacterium]
MPNLSTLNYGKTCLAEGVQHIRTLGFYNVELYINNERSSKQHISIERLEWKGTGYTYIKLDNDFFSNSEQEVYIKANARILNENQINNISTWTSFVIEFIENTLLASPSVKINYHIEYLSKNSQFKSIFPSDRGEYKLVHFDSLFSYTRTYYSLEDRFYALRSLQPRFQNTFNDSLSNVSFLDRKVKLNNEAMIDESHIFYVNNVKSIKGDFILFPISASINLLSIEVEANIKGEKFIAVRIDSTTYSSILNGNDSVSYPVYYYGPKTKNNPLWYLINVFIPNDGIQRISAQINFQYNSKKIISNTDNYNFELKYYVWPMDRVYSDKLYIQIPDQFHFINSNYENHIIDSSNSYVLYIDMNKSSASDDPVTIIFKRDGTELLDYVRYFNYFLLLCSIVFIALYIIKYLDLNSILIYLSALSVVASTLVSIVLNENYLASIIYSQSYIAIVLIVIITLYIKLKKNQIIETHHNRKGILAKKNIKKVK